MYSEGMKQYDHLNRCWKIFDIIQQVFVKKLSKNWTFKKLPQLKKDTQIKTTMMYYLTPLKNLRH